VEEVRIPGRRARKCGGGVLDDPILKQLLQLGRAGWQRVHLDCVKAAQALQKHRSGHCSQSGLARGRTERVVTGCVVRGDGPRGRLSGRRPLLRVLLGERAVTEVSLADPAGVLRILGKPVLDDGPTGEVVALLALVTAAAALVAAFALALTRRYRELRAALLATGVLAVPRAVAAESPEDSFLPVAGRPVPRGLRVTTTDGTDLDADYFAAPGLVMVFLMDQCTSASPTCPGCRPPWPPGRRLSRARWVLSGPLEVLGDFRA
jgi:hypothetical protein